MKNNTLDKQDLFEGRGLALDAKVHPSKEAGPPRNPERPVGIDLFAGVGGLSLGFEQAGFDIAAAVELDPVHCATYSYNFPTTAVICASVTDLTGQDIRERAGIGDRTVDCVFGGAPSQGFSIIGKRSIDDPRNRLGLEFARLVHELDARSFVFENVSGIMRGAHIAVLDELIGTFEDRGYAVRTQLKTLNACHFGVPQSREHFILLGAKRGERLPSYPSAICNARGRAPVDASLPLGPSVGDALCDLPDAEQCDALLHGDVAHVYDFGRRTEYSSLMRCETPAAWHFGYRREWKPWLMTASARTDHSSITRRRFAATAPGDVEPISRFYKLDPNGISNTLRAGTDSAAGAFTSPRPIHYRYDRCITVREMARLHGFPDWFRPHSTKWHGGRQIGLAVPPPLARAIGQQVIAALGVEPTIPVEVLAQDRGEGLTLTPSAAAQRYAVSSPPAKRDRRSHYRKRSQLEIEAERVSDLGASEKGRGR